MTWESHEEHFARVLLPRTRDVLARTGVNLSLLYPRWDGDRILQIVLPSGIHEDAQRALLSDPVSSELGYLTFDDRTRPALDMLGLPTLRGVRLASAEYTDGRPGGDHDASALLAAAPQLQRLEARARRLRLASHAQLEALDLQVATWPFPRGLALPALKQLRISSAGAIEARDIDALRECAPALEWIVLLDPLDSVLRALRDAAPLAIQRVFVSGAASVALGRDLVIRPGSLADLPSITVECSGNGRRWLDCFAGDRETRGQKLATKGAQWLELFAGCTEPPAPDIVVDGVIAFRAFSPREQALRDCGADAAQVLVYADWLEERGDEAMAVALRRANLAQPMFAIQRADDNYRDSFRRTALVLLDAWRQLSPSAPVREDAVAFRERIHSHLQNLSFRKLSKRDAASLAAIEQHVPEEQREAIGKLLRVVQILPQVFAVESTNGYLVVLTHGWALVP